MSQSTGYVLALEIVIDLSSKRALFQIFQPKMQINVPFTQVTS